MHCRSMGSRIFIFCIYFIDVVICKISTRGKRKYKVYNNDGHLLSYIENYYVFESNLVYVCKDKFYDFKFIERKNKERPKERNAEK